ncbi:MAG: MmcQ/YjbR family DNA-binding protein [Bacteroidetes bacterium]|nr:MAG: MmcQ/YjbR family DNA-binding protein [Bacteroidota bacterium]
MISVEMARQATLSLPQAEEYRHFHLPAFRVNKKIFATIHEDKNFMMVKLSLIDQSVFCSFNKGIIFPVPGGWGRHGSTFIDLKKVKKNLFKDALTTAWKNVAGPKLVAKYFSDRHSM